MTDRAGGDAEVRIRLVGPFAVTRAGRPVSGAELGSRKARLLAKLLAVDRGRLVSTTRIVEILWAGEVPPALAVENVATLVSRLRRVLGAAAIEGGRHGYQLGASAVVQVDLDLAAGWVREAKERVAAGEPGLGLAAAERAYELVGDGVLLPDELDAGWADPARVELAALLRDVRHALGVAALAAGDPARALAPAKAARTSDPYDETACRLLMRTQSALGEPAAALATYADLRDLLARELGADPSAETQQLHLSLLRDEPVPPPATVATRGPATSGTATRGAEWAGLVGRGGEMRELREAWNAAATGTGSVTLLAGEAGIGKTRLSEELGTVAESTGGIVLRCRCYETERSLFLQPAIDAVAAAFRTLPPEVTREAAGEWTDVISTLVPSAVAILGPAPTTGHGPVEVERRRAFEALTAFLRRLAGRAPLLVLVDDLHIAGRATIELLHYLARHSGASRLMVVATVRAEEGREVLTALQGVADVVQLGPLSSDAVVQLAAAAGQSEQVESILQRTGGHTFFVVESLRALGAGETGVPISLQDAVLSRVRRAPTGVEELLRAGSVLGASFEPAVAARLLDEPLATVLARGEDALAARLLVASGRDYEFANDLIREVLYATTPAPTRLAHHARAADLLTGRPEAVAVHAAAGEDWLRAARALLLAGEEALERFAADDAEELLTRSLGLAGRAGAVELRARALLARAKARSARAAYPEAIADLGQAVRLSREIGDRRLEMLAERALGGDASASYSAAIAEAADHLRRGLQLAGALGDRAMESDFLGWLAVMASNNLQLQEAVDYGLRAVAAARASGSDEALAAALDGRKTSLAYLGEIDQLVPVLEELAPLARRFNHPLRLPWMIFESGFPALAAGDWVGASVWFTRALDACRRTGYVAYECWHVAHLGSLARLRGDHEAAVELGRRAVALSANAPHAWGGPTAAALLGITLLELGDVDGAIAVLEQGREMVPEKGSQAYLLRCLAPLAEATGRRETLEEADRLLGSLTTPPGTAWMAGDFTYLSIARAWLAADEPQRARDVLAPMLAVAERVPWVAPLAYGSLVDARAAAALGQADAASRLLARAADLADRYGLPTLTRQLATP